MASDGDFVELRAGGGRGSEPQPRRVLPPVIRREQVVLGPPRKVGGKEVPPPEEPVLRVHQKDGVVEEIEVICPCGRAIRIKCDYDEPISS